MYICVKKTIIVLFFITIFLTIISSVSASINVPYIKLPPDEISMQVDYPGIECYYNVILSDVPIGYHVSNGIYLGWCVDEYHKIIPGETYKATMYSTYDPNNPHPDPDWDKVNYILNHKQGTAKDIQEAIWYFVDGGNLPSTDAGKAMVNEAETNGEGYIPTVGQTLAVVLWINSTTQVPIIEVSVPLQNVVPEYPLGPILGLSTLMIACVFFKYKHKIPIF